MKNLQRLIGGIAAAGIGLALWRMRPRDFRGKVVLITGGSRGLGLVLARELGRLGARVMILARDPEELLRAAEDLRKRGIEAATFVGDVTEADVAPRAVAETVRVFGRLDVLINNAGIIVVAPIGNLNEADYGEAMATHLWAPLRFMNAALPELRRSCGRIVNICSIGGKVAVPHMASYSASKFALAGLSDAYRAELAADGIRVTSVFPGLMRTGSHLQAQFKGQQAKEFGWFSLGSATPLTSISVERAARQIVRACADGRAELVISIQARLAVLGQAVFPNTAAWLAKVVDGLLPDVGGDTPARPGVEVRGAFPPRLATVLADQASAANNELGGTKGLGAPIAGTMAAD